MPTIADIRNKIRRVTGSPDSAQISDTEIDSYINSFYLYRLPVELSSMRPRGWFTLITQANQDTYAVSQQNLILDSPVYCGGQRILLFQNPDQFYNAYPPSKQSGLFATGNGGMFYSGTLSATPVLQGSVVIGSGGEAFTDSSGSLVSTLGGTGTINYLTGVVSLTFVSSVSSGVRIEAEWQPYTASRPRGVLFYEQKLTLRPVPDRNYELRISNLIRPEEISASNPQPLFDEWSDVIALGSSLLIFEDRGDFDNVQKYSALYQQRRTSSQRRTILQLATQRAIAPNYFNGVSNDLFTQ
jgi:hypothetical protein